MNFRHNSCSAFCFISLPPSFLCITFCENLRILPSLEEHVEDPGGVASTIPSGPSPPPPPAFRGLHSLGLSDELWRYHRDLSLERMRQMEPIDPRHQAVPMPYCNAYCLDTDLHGRSSFGYPSATLQVTSRDDGQLYCIKRFDNVRSVSPKIAATVSDRWTARPTVQDHPGAVPLYLCFVAQRAVFFVHPYIPGARTLAFGAASPSSCRQSEPSTAAIWLCGR
jgi:hypothetical protein